MCSTQSSVLSPPSSRSGWLSLDEAARRSGRSAGHLRRKASGEWLARGLSRLASGGGKRARYEVREDADASFARVKFPEQIGTNLAAVSEAKRKEALARKRILDDWESALSGRHALGFSEQQITAQFLGQLETRKDGRRISRATLYNWNRAWRKAGLAGLIDSRGCANLQPPTSNPFFEEVKRLYLLPRRLRLSVCWEMAALKAPEQGWKILSAERCRQLLAAMPAGVVIKNRLGEDAYVAAAEPYLERDYSTMESNEIWNADHHQLDVICRRANGEHFRPWLTAWQDLRSRKIVGWVLVAHDPNTDTIIESFRRAVLDSGVPKQTYVDNGKDFDSYALHGRTKADRWEKRAGKIALDEAWTGGIFTGLGIEAHNCWAYHGQSKPIERFFGTLETAAAVWPTYCGKDTSSKPHDLQLQLERGHAPTLEEMDGWLAEWIRIYHATPHGGDAMEGRSPDAVFATCLATKRTAPADLVNLLCLQPTPPLKVGQNGVTYKHLRYGQYDLAKYLGQEVTLRVDNRDLSAVRVFAMDGKFLCIAAANAKIPANATSQELRAAIAQKGRARKADKDYHQTRTARVEDYPDLILRARAAANEAAKSIDNAPPPPPTLMPVRSALEDQLPAIARAIEAGRGTLRLAAGAEGMSFEDLTHAAANAGSGAGAGGNEAPDPEPAMDPFAALMHRVAAGRETP